MPMPNLYDELRDKTQELMERKGWNQSDLADKLGIFQQSVSKWLKSEAHEGTLSPLVLDRLVQMLRKEKLIEKKL